VKVTSSLTVVVARDPCLVDVGELMDRLEFPDMLYL